MQENSGVVSQLAVEAIGHRLLAAGAGRTPALYRGLNGALIARCADDPALMAALFRFIDCLPRLLRQPDPDQAVADHLAAYLAGLTDRDWAAGLLKLLARPGLAWLVQGQVRRLARQLLAEESESGLPAVIRQLAGVPASVTVDAVGEAVLSEAEADAYQARNLRLLQLLQNGSGAPHLSLKLSALTPRFNPLDPEATRHAVFRRLEPIIEAAMACGATLNIDMEHYELKPLIFQLFLDLLEAFPDPAWLPAIALQAYLPESSADLDRLLAAGQRHGRRLGVRLVKGAYRDQEAAWAAQRHWPLPTFAEKTHSDWHYEGLTERLLQATDALYPAIAGHNLRSQAHALAVARHLHLAADQWEVQMLYGMGEPLRDALAADGVALRIYVPTGNLDTGMAYLIRRLLENTASTSILRQTHLDGANLEQILASPAAPAPKAESPAPGWHNLPLLDFSRESVRRTFAAELAAVAGKLPESHPLPGDGETTGETRYYLARNPAAQASVLGRCALADRSAADRAVTVARQAFPAWSETPASQRMAMLRRAADLIVAERYGLAALEVLEAGKSWREADGDVAEAVDFLRYYAQRMAELEGWKDTVRLPGEDNASTTAARGVAVVIAPWNFPLAILCGMTSAALVTGNTVIMKPALAGLLMAHRFADLLRRAGIPQEVCQLVPGESETGRQLVAHPEVDIIAFTGSRAVGLDILHTAHSPAAGQFHVKQVVCEMGGKNAIIVDDDADLDEAVAGILASAFGFQGQKCSACSRLIAVGSVHDALLDRLVAAADALLWGDPRQPAVDYGPLISEAARDKARSYLHIGRQEGTLVWQGRVPQDTDAGWYFPPCIFSGIGPQHRLAREEIFAPVLAVLHAPDFATALEWANDSEYALTGGVYSRLPDHLAMARQRLRVGNLYLNRKTTGARVGIQPFGGVRLSGTGVQAGGPDYLKQFLWTRCVSENNQRHGFIPD